MELRHLRYFVAVAEERHVTRAAERLGIQQPPLSQQIRALEEELGVRLFHRKPRGVELTDVGRIFCDDVRRILADVERAKATALRMARGMQGKIALGFTLSSSLNPFVPKVIRAFQKEFPDVSLNLEEADTGSLINALRTEALDVALVRSKLPKGEGLVSETVLEEPMVAALPENHEICARNPEAIALTAFRHERLILSRRAFGFGGMYNAIYDAVVDACREAGFEPPIAQESPQIITAITLVASGMGVSLVPASMQNIQIPGVRLFNLTPETRLSASVYLTFRPTGLSVAALNFVQLVRRHARS